MASIRNNDGLKTSRYSIKAVLERRGVTASGRRVGGIMRERGTWARTRADDPNRTGCGLANRGIAGHAAGRARDAGLVLAAFCTLDFLLAGVQVFHTDRGDEFDNTRIDELLDVFDIKGSLPRKGNPYDNAVAESTNRPLKKELVYRTATPRSSN
ncbi:integrase [Bifidobacterium pseudocatenulatum]|uniref:Integrase n=2 Tax=Bifidobacterium pseudocatenulatum TaxID=28026 RepID=A0A267WLL1_BIFPS|nr:integrase [Bifidobacterium pseudocatenulatum]